MLIPSGAAWMAEPAEWALGVPLWPEKAAGVHHARVTQCEVEADGIVGIEPSQGLCDVHSHLPTGGHVPRQAQAASETNDMRVERHD